MIFRPYFKQILILSSLIVFVAIAWTGIWWATRKPTATPIPLGMPSRFPPPDQIVSDSIRARLISDPDEVSEANEACLRIFVKKTPQGRPISLFCQRRSETPDYFEISLDTSSGFKGRWYYKDMAIEYDPAGVPSIRYLFLAPDRVEKRKLSEGILADELIETNSPDQFGLFHLLENL
jgi:hypothetical protein